MRRAKYLAPLFGALAFTLSSCGGGSSGGGGSPEPPFISAELNSFPAGSVPPGFTNNATVSVLDDSSGASISNAAVTMNGVALAYNAANEDYEGNVVVAPGGTVSLSVTTGAGTFTSSATQFTSYPTLSTPAPLDTWDSSVQNTATWSGGAPTTNAEYLLGILDAVDPNGLVQWPESNFLKEVPLATTSFSIPAASIPAGNRHMVVGIASSGSSIPNAAPGSGLFVAGFNYVPIAVTGFPVTVRAMGPVIFPSVASSGTNFVAVGIFPTTITGAPPTSAILTSPDGIVWTSGTPSSSDALAGVTWSGTQFVAVGTNGTILSSADGATWTTRLAGFTLGGFSTALNAVASSGTVLVAVGQGVSLGVILSSPDGVAWTSRSSGTSSQLLGVTWSGTQFVAVGVGGVILTSPDGATWTVRAPGNGPTLRGVAWSGAQFVAVGSGAILTSPDGITWTPRSGATGPLNAVAWTGTQFVAVGDSGGSSGTILTSSDGVTWTRRASGAASNLTGVVGSDAKLVIVGNRAALTSP